MNTIAAVFAPPVLAIFAALSLGFGAILFLISRRTNAASIDPNTPLSWAEPVEMRLVLYLILGATCGTGALVLRLLLGFFTPGAVLAWALLVLVVVGFAGNLAFFYAAGGSLLQGALGTQGRPSFWFNRLLSPVDGAVMDAGDVLARLLFHPAPSLEQRRGRRTYEHEDDYDIERERRFAEPPRRRRYHAADASGQQDASEVDQDANGSRPRRVPPEPAHDDELRFDEEDDYMGPAGADVAHDQPHRRDPTPPRDIPRERLDLALQQYESALTPSQREKLREMRSIIESIKQCA